ncbi:acyltransferase [Paraburkholderia azotifigens]|uniref:acyltransferase family protein n=1 Tax=Paraburkholderia azotifigens TaxID=2057004 RepID=UPI003180D0D5
MRPGPATTKNREIQILRGISIAFVLIQHYGPTLPVPHWYYRAMDATSFRSGVDLFFVISGFVISRSIAGAALPGIRLNRSTFLRFWVRRAFRLMPAAWLWALIVVGTSFFVSSMDFMQPALVAKGALAGMFGYSNWIWASCLAHHGIGSACPNLYATSIYWSLSLEEQFYVALSIALLMVPLRAVLIGGIAAALLLHATGDDLYIYFFRFGAMVVGVGLFWLTTTNWYRPSWRLIQHAAARRASLAFALATIAGAASISHQHTIPIVAAAAGLAVWVCSFDATIPESRVSRAFSWVGDRSYSLYLCHLPVFIMVREVMMRAGAKGYWDSAPLIWCAVPLAIGAALLAADATYRLVELPLSALGRAVIDREDVAAIAVSSASMPPTGR